MLILIMAGALAFNILVILWKYKHDRVFDAFLDGAILMGLATIFGGSQTSLMIATIASAIVSVSLPILLRKKSD